MSRWRTRIQFSIIAALLALGCAGPMQAAAADMSKTLHVILLNGESGIDPATAFEANTMSLIENIFDTLLRYDYLARPLKLQPNTLSAMPEISDSGTAYTIHIKPGIYFTPDPAFNGTKRELTAADYVYSFKRLYDPELKSPWLFLLDGKIAGDKVLKDAAKQGKFNYDIPVEGLQAIDRYTLRLRIKEADNNFLFVLAMPATGVVAREVIEAHTANPGAHPIGTGPYIVREWQRNHRILLEANPDFRETMYNGTPGNTPELQAIAAALKGKRLPLIGRVEVKVVEEHLSQVLGFLDRQFDYIELLPPPLSHMALIDGKLKPELAKQGVQLTMFPLLQTDYMWMNMDDPVVGGYTEDKIALRRAIALSYNQKEDIRVLDKGLAIPAQSPLPPNVLGYDPSYRSSAEYNPTLARALLDRYGYKDRDGDGYRETPDGKPLTLVMHSRASTTGRLRDELWNRSLDAIGIRIVFKSDKYTEIIKASRLGKVQMFEFGWVADFPDGENFFQLLYGPNIGISNDARFNLPAFNRLYEQARKLPDSPARNVLYRDMSRLIEAYTPWVIRKHPLSADVRHPWVKNYKRHPEELTAWRYLDIDVGAQKAAH